MALPSTSTHLPNSQSEMSQILNGGCVAVGPSIGRDPLVFENIVLLWYSLLRCVGTVWYCMVYYDVVLYGHNVVWLCIE